MKYLITFLLGALIADAQSKLEVTGDAFIQPGSTSVLSTSRTWALVVGISKYRELPRDAELRYAHSDAQNFYEYLTSPTGGQVKPETIRLLLDEEATASEIYAGLEWLLEKVQPLDKVIFFFAGHGDVETKTLRQRGFLLAHDSPRAGYHAGGTLQVGYLQDYLETLSTQNKASVLLLVDACRAGKLAGGDDGQAQTTASLRETWSNIVKVLSSQPGEKSLEGTNWGNGYGVFTYFLIDGLKGLADQNDDGFVSLSELNMFLSTEVPRATSEKQNPMVSGSLKIRLSQVNPSELALVRTKRALQSHDHATVVAKRGNTSTDTLSEQTQKNYRLFRQALQRQNLITPGGQNALYYLRLIEREGNQELSSDLRRALVAAIEKNTQIVINRYMINDKRLQSKEISQAASEMKTAVSLIRENDIRYRSMKAKELFLDIGFLTCICHGDEFSSEITTNALQKLRLAAAYEPDAAYLYNSMGNVHYSAKSYDSAEFYYQKASALAPKWSYPVNNLGTVYLSLGKKKLAIEYYEKASALDPDFAHIYNNLGNLYQDQDKAIYFYQKALSVDDSASRVFYYSQIGKEYLMGRKSTRAKAFEYFDRLMGIDSYDAAYQLESTAKDLADWGFVEESQRYYEEAEKVYDRLIDKEKRNSPLDSAQLAVLLEDRAQIYIDCAEADGFGPSSKEQILNSLSLFRQAVALLPRDPDIMFSKANAEILAGEQISYAFYDSAKRTARQALQLNPVDQSYYWGQLGDAQYRLEQYDSSLLSLNQALTSADAASLSNYQLTKSYSLIALGRQIEGLQVAREMLSSGYKPDVAENEYFAEIAVEAHDYALAELFVANALSQAKKENVSPATSFFLKARIYDARQNSTEALAWLKKAFASGYEADIEALKTSPFVHINKDPRFTALLRKAQLSAKKQ